NSADHAVAFTIVADVEIDRRRIAGDGGQHEPAVGNRNPFRCIWRCSRFGLLRCIAAGAGLGGGNRQSQGGADGLHHVLFPLVDVAPGSSPAALLCQAEAPLYPPRIEPPTGLALDGSPTVRRLMF